MSYYHDLFQRFDDCPVSVAFTEDWRQLAVPRQFPSLMVAVDHIVDQQRDVQSAVVTAHTPVGPVDLGQDELSTVVALAETIRNCQD